MKTEKFTNCNEFRTKEIIPNIRRFIKDNVYYLTGKILDYGCGQQPYKDLIQGEYFPYDPHYKVNILPKENFDCVMMIQVIMYLDDPIKIINSLDTKYLLVICSSCWRELDNPGGDVYPEKELWRYTRWGLHRLFDKCGFAVEKQEYLVQIEIADLVLPIIHGMIGRKK